MALASTSAGLRWPRPSSGRGCRRGFTAAACEPASWLIEEPRSRPLYLSHHAQRDGLDLGVRQMVEGAERDPDAVNHSGSPTGRSRSNQRRVPYDCSGRNVSSLRALGSAPAMRPAATAHQSSRSRRDRCSSRSSASLVSSSSTGTRSSGGRVGVSFTRRYTKGRSEEGSHVVLEPRVLDDVDEVEGFQPRRGSLARRSSDALSMKPSSEMRG